MADGDNTGKNKDFLDEFLKSFSESGMRILTAFETNINPSLTQLTSTINAFEATAVSSIKTLGLGRDRIVEMKASMADARSSMQLMGADLEQIGVITQEVGNGLNRNIILTSESYSKLYAAAEATGVQYATLIPNMKDAGISLYQVNKNMEKVVNTARASGLNVKEVSKNVVDNMEMMDKFNFAGGIQGLAKMVTTATNLRVSVNEIERVMDKAFEPESAIEMAAALQRLGVAQGELLDPLRLMDLAQNDPTELTRQIGDMSKSFVEFNQQTKAFEIAPGAKRQLQEVATALGMQPAAFAKMAKAAAEMDDKLKKISFPDTFTDEQKKFVANMAEMGEGGEYMLRVNGEDMGIDKAMKVFQEQPEVYKKFMSEAQPKTLEQLTKEQLTVEERQAGILASIANRLGAAVASSEAIETFKDASVKLYETLPTVVSGKQLQTSGIRQDLINKNTSTITEGFQKGDIIGALGEVKKDLGGYISNAFTQLVSGGGEAYGQLKNSGNPIIEGFTNVAESAVKLVGKSESLDGSFFNLNSKVSETTTSLGKLNTVLTTNENISETNKKLSTIGTTNENISETNKKLSTIGTTNKSGTESTTNEILFSEPLKINISLSGLQPGMSEAELIRMFEEGKLNQLIQKAVTDAMKLKVSP